MAMTWVLGVTALSWGIFLYGVIHALFRHRSDLFSLVFFLAALQYFLLGLVAVQNGLAVWLPIGSATITWFVAMVLILSPFLLMGFSGVFPAKLMATLLMFLLGGLVAFALSVMAKLWGFGYLKAVGIFFWPLALLSLSLVLGMLHMFGRLSPPPRKF